MGLRIQTKFVRLRIKTNEKVLVSNINCVCNSFLCTTNFNVSTSTNRHVFLMCIISWICTVNSYIRNCGQMRTKTKTTVNWLGFEMNTFDLLMMAVLYLIIAFAIKDLLCLIFGGIALIGCIANGIACLVRKE